MATPSDESPKTPVTEPIPTARPAAPKKLRPTRISGTWVAVLIALVVLIFLLVFILQNGDGATIHFMWIEASLPLGVALLFSAIGGALLVAIVGAARILQLRRQAKRLTGRPESASPAPRES